MIMAAFIYAAMAELVDALDSGSSGRLLVEVRVFSWAPLGNAAADDGGGGHGGGK